MPNGWTTRLLPRCLFFAGLLSILATRSAADDGQELLHAARDGNAQLAIELIHASADVHQRGTLGETALHWAAFSGSHTLARLLIEHGADVDARVRNGNTPLHQAAYGGHLQVVALLVASGATLSVVNQSGLTPAEWARQNEHVGVFRYLVAHGAQANPLASQNRRLAGAQSAAKQRRFAASQVQAPAKQETKPARFPGFSTQLGDLLPLVLKVPSRTDFPAPMLREANSLGFESEGAVRSPASGASRELANRSRRAVSIQLGSFSSRLRAQAQWRDTVGDHADLISKRQPSIVAAHIGENRTVHRLRLGPLSFGEATRLCAAFVARKAPCLVVSSTRSPDRQ
jgi:hypothetical protein